MTIDTKRLATDAAYWRECGAPEDAKYYCTEAKGFHAHQTARSCCIPRPQAPEAEWNGVSPLPIDLLLEVSVYSQQWRKAKIKAINGEQCWLYVFGAGDIVEPMSECIFRAIRNKAQRDRDELTGLILENWPSGYKNLADAIIASGWRKES